jgi:hypothetical protein
VRGFAGCVNTLKRDGFRSGGLQPGIAPSTTYARLRTASTEYHLKTHAHYRAMKRQAKKGKIGS